MAAENRKLLAKVRAGGEGRAGLRVLGLLAAGAAAKRHPLIANDTERCSLEQGCCCFAGCALLPCAALPWGGLQVEVALS